MAQMKHYYYWNNQLPSGKTDETSPDIYFKSLLVSQDHFSSILQTKNISTYGNTLANTFGFDFIQISQNGNIHNIISQVVPILRLSNPGSPGEIRLQHGMINFLHPQMFQISHRKRLAEIHSG